MTVEPTRHSPQLLRELLGPGRRGLYVLTRRLPCAEVEPRVPTGLPNRQASFAASTQKVVCVAVCICSGCGQVIPLASFEGSRA